MRLYRPIRAVVERSPRDKRKQSGMSLAEMAVTLGVGSIVLMIVGILSVTGLRCFLVMGNCTALDDKNRLAADQITRELRQATRVVSYQANDDGKTLVLTNSVQGFSIGYTWSAETRTLICEKTDQPQFTCLTDCDSWEVFFFQSIPQPSPTMTFLPATNALGNPALDQARLVGLSWRCSLPVAGSDTKTESAQTLQILLRNTTQP